VNNALFTIQGLTPITDHSNRLWW